MYMNSFRLQVQHEVPLVATNLCCLSDSVGTGRRLGEEKMGKMAEPSNSQEGWSCGWSIYY